MNLTFDRHVRPIAAMGHFAAASRIAARIRDRPVAAFLTMAFGGMWACWLPVLLLDAPARPFSAVGALVGLALPALLVTGVKDGRAGVRDLLGRSLRQPTSIPSAVVALLGLPVVMLLIAIVILGMAPLVAITEHWTLVFTVFVPEVVIALASIQLFEEVGWTGFVQQTLQDRHGALKASLLVAVAFALIHFPTYLVGVPITIATVLQTLVLMLPLALFAVFFRILHTWVYNGSGRSILLAALLHAAFNTLSGTSFTPVFVPRPMAMWLPLAAVALLATLVAAATRCHLAYKAASDQGVGKATVGVAALTAASERAL